MCVPLSFLKRIKGSILYGYTAASEHITCLNGSVVISISIHNSIVIVYFSGISIESFLLDLPYPTELYTRVKFGIFAFYRFRYSNVYDLVGTNVSGIVIIRHHCCCCYCYWCFRVCYYRHGMHFGVTVFLLHRYQ